MKTDRIKRLGHYLWRILVVLLVNIMILLMLWNSGGARALSKYSSRGGEVTGTQQRLQALGYEPGAADGIYGK